MNSSIEITEAAKLAEKLIDRTVEGKLSWEAVAEAHMMAPLLNMSDAKSFTTQLEPNLKATVSQRGEDVLDFSLVEFVQLSSFAPPIEKPYPDKIVISVSVEKDPPYGYDTKEEKYLAGRLVDLFGVARRSALKIDASVEKALSYLDRIAG
jgi:hypothetical protein